MATADSEHNRERKPREGRGSTEERNPAWLLLRHHKESHSGDNAGESSHTEGGRCRHSVRSNVEEAERKRASHASSTAGSKRTSGEREGRRGSREMRDEERGDGLPRRDSRHRAKTSSQEKDDDKVWVPAGWTQRLSLILEQDGKGLGNKVKGWARRKGSSVKRRGSEEIVCVNHNPIHNFIKVGGASSLSRTSPAG